MKSSLVLHALFDQPDLSLSFGFGGAVRVYLPCEGILHSIALLVADFADFEIGSWHLLPYVEEITCG